MQRGSPRRRRHRRLAMFAQVIQGRTSDPQALRSAMDRWTRELGPGSIGWLGSTGGVTDDGRFIAVARFSSAEAAGRNAARPEQTRWWEDNERLLDGEARFLESEDVTVDLRGDPDTVGFVQEMQGRVTDADRGRTQVLYFTSEADAREGERKDTPPELQAVMDELIMISKGPPDFFDL